MGPFPRAIRTESTSSHETAASAVRPSLLSSWERAMKRILLFLVLCVATVPAMAWAQQRPLAFRGAWLIPITSEPIERGVLVVKDGIIVAVGAEGAVEIPADAEVHDVSGKVIMPGLVDTHSHIGGGDGGDRSAPMHPDVRILDAIDARNDGIQKAQAGGITTVNVMPGSGHL